MAVMRKRVFAEAESKTTGMTVGEIQDFINSTVDSSIRSDAAVQVSVGVGSQIKKMWVES